jgi:ketosteroid isomerase-like protein
MSLQNVEIVRRFYRAFNRRDFDDAVKYLDRQVELIPGVTAPDAEARYLGHQGMQEFFEIATGPWETVTVEPKEMIDITANRILTIDRWRFRGRDGIEVARELPTAYAFRSGLIVRIDGFTDKDEALEALGLRE